QWLLLPAPFASESWLDPFLYAAGVDLFINLGPDALSMSVPYVTMVYDLQHRSQPFMPEVSARGYWERWDQQYREHLGRATFVINGTRRGPDDVVRLQRRPAAPGAGLRGGGGEPATPAAAAVRGRRALPVLSGAVLGAQEPRHAARGARAAA